MRDRNFYINSIKMDLYRVVTASGDIRKPIAADSVKQFLEHAINDFDKFENNKHDKKLKENLLSSMSDLYNLKDPLQRLRWVENVLTTRCRMY